MKCNITTIRHGYPEIHRWLRNLYWTFPAFKDTTNSEHIKRTYYQTQKHVRWFFLGETTHGLSLTCVPGLQFNPTGIIPLGPTPYIEPL